MKARTVAAAAGAALAGVAGWDLTQRRHALLRNYPLVGHLRYLLEGIGPELRQYIVTDNDDERPFSRDQRRWVYTSAKSTDRYFGFGTDNDLERVSNYLIVKHAAFPVAAPAGEPHRPDPARPLAAWIASFAAFVTMCFEFWLANPTTGFNQTAVTPICRQSAPA